MAKAAVVFPVTSAVDGEFRQPFELEQDDQHPEWNFKAVYDFPGKGNGAMVTEESGGKVYGRLPLGKLVSLGCKTLRLYAPEAGEMPAIRSLEPLTGEVPDVYTLSQGLATAVFNTRRGYDGRQVVAMGVRQEQRTEVLEFAGDTVQQLQYGAIGRDARVVYASDFVTADGLAAAVPTQQPGGRFVADAPVYGALQLEYQVSYRLYRVYYTVPDPAWNIELSDNGKLLRYDELNDAPAMGVVATRGGRIALLRIPRDYSLPNVSWNRRDDQPGDWNLTEESRKTTSQTLVDENNPNNSVDIEQVTEVVLVDEAGRRLKLKMVSGQ